MTQDPNDIFPTLRELQEMGSLGIDFSTLIEIQGVGDFHFIHEFKPLDLRNRTNLELLVQELREHARKRFPELEGRSVLTTASRNRQTRVPISGIVIVNPKAELLVRAWELLEHIEQTGHVDGGDAYWAAINPIIQKTWDEAPMPERLKLCRESPQEVLDKEVPFDAYTLIYQDLDI